MILSARKRGKEKDRERERGSVVFQFSQLNLDCRVSITCYSSLYYMVVVELKFAIKVNAK